MRKTGKISHQEKPENDFTIEFSRIDRNIMSEDGMINGTITALESEIPGLLRKDEETTVYEMSEMDHISGMEEVISFIRSVRSIDEGKLRQYLIDYGSQFLFQKIGYMLETYGNMETGDEFYEFCQKNIKKSKRYLSKDMRHGVYNQKWKLVVPDAVAYSKNGEQGA